MAEVFRVQGVVRPGHYRHISCIGDIVAIMLELRTLLSVSSTRGTVCQQTVCIFPPLWHSNEQSNKFILRRFYILFVGLDFRFLDGLLLVPLRGLLIHSHIVSMHSLPNLSQGVEFAVDHFPLKLTDAGGD